MEENNQEESTNEKEDLDKKGESPIKKVVEAVGKATRAVGNWFKNLFRGKKTDSEMVGEEGKEASDEQKWTAKRIVLAIVACLFGLLILSIAVFAVGIYGYNWDNRPAEVAKKYVPYPAAMVGIDVIPISEVEEEATHISHFYSQSQQGATQAPESETVKNQVLERLVNDKIIQSLAYKYDVTVDSKEVGEQYDKIVKENGGEEKVKTLLADLYDLTVPQFKDLIEDQLQREKLKQKFEDEIRKKVKAKHILIKIPSDASKKEKQEIEKKAKNILKKAQKEDADFAKLAKKYSEDKASKDDGGQLPWFGKGDMVEEFENAVFSMDVGQTSDLVKTKYGYHIIFVEEKKGEVEENFEGWLEKIKKDRIVWKLMSWGTTEDEKTD